MSADPTPIDLREKLAQFDELWSPKIIAQLNDYHFKLAKVAGEFVWHSHPDTDEAFYVIEGELEIRFRQSTAVLKPGSMLVVPRGVEHQPFAAETCHLLLIEPAGTPNTGDAGGERTVEPAWI